MSRPEILTEGKIFPFPYGMYQQLVSGPIAFDVPAQAQAFHYAYGGRIDLTGRANRQTIVRRPPDGYHYQLEGVRIYYPQNPANLATLWLHLVQEQRARDLVVDPTPVPLLTSPGDARPKHYMVRTNTLIGANSQLKIEITGSTGVVPGYVDWMTEGIMIPATGTRLV